MSDEVVHMEAEAAAASTTVGLHTLAAPATQPRMSSQGPLGGLAAAGSSEPRWLATAVGRREWPPQVLPDAHCTSCTAQNASPGPCFCLCSAPQNWAPSVTLLLPGALLLCPATRLHYFTSTQMCCVVLRIPWR